MFTFSNPSAFAQEDPVTKTESLVYKNEPRRKLTIYYPDNWKTTDKRPALVIFRCSIPEQREHFRKLGMVVIKPQTAPVNSGNLPKMSLEEIAKAAKPREQVADSKSAIRFIRANAAKLGIDPGKIVATGTSGGGDLALQAHLNQTFDHADENLSVSSSPDVLVLYCPAFDGINIWFVKTAPFVRRVREEAPSFIPLLDKFIEDQKSEYAKPIDHRAALLKLAGTLGKEKSFDAKEVEDFQLILGLFNKRDWQLLHPAEDALKMSASRTLTRERSLPPTFILFGDRDHLYEHQMAFVAKARDLGQTFDLKIYKGGGHSFMIQPAFLKPSTQEVQEFLRKQKILPVEN